MNDLKVWKDGENLVAEYLKKQKYKIIYKNFSCKIAELDIVAILPKIVQKKNLKQEMKLKILHAMSKNERSLLRYSYKSQLKILKDVLVIVEVKSRSSKKYGSGFDAISEDKIVHLKRGAEVLLKMKKYKNMQIRFDVASVDLGEITYIENAF